MGSRVLYALFFCSGISGLVYQVAWVRQLGHAFGNTVHSTSLVVAVFMLGLGAGGYAAGVWADRRHQSSASPRLKAKGRRQKAEGPLLQFRTERPKTED